MSIPSEIPNVTIRDIGLPLNKTTHTLASPFAIDKQFSHILDNTPREVEIGMVNAVNISTLK